MQGVTILCTDMHLCLLARMSDDARDHTPPTKSQVLTDHGVYMTICQTPEICMYAQTSDFQNLRQQVQYRID